MSGGTTWSGVSAADRESLKTYHEIKDDYDDKNLVGQLKVAAIDAYMKTHKGGHWALSERVMRNTSVVGDGYSGKFPNGAYIRDHALGDDFIYVRPSLLRRGACGSKGGEAYHAILKDKVYGVVGGTGVAHYLDVEDRRPGKDLDFAGKMDEIDAVLANWWDLPATGAGTGGEFGPATAIANDLADLAYNLGVEDSSIVGNSGDLDVFLGINGSRSSIYYYADQEGMKAEGLREWFTVFVLKLPRAIGSCGRIVGWLATVVAAQARAWHVTKADVTQAVEAALANFNAVAIDAGGLNATEARFMKAAKDIAASFLPKPVKSMYDAFEIEDYVNKKIDGATEAPGRNYESVMQKFKQSMTKIEHHVSDSEEAIASVALALLQKVKDEKDTTFNLCSNQSGSDASIKIPPGGQIDIAYDPVASVTNILRDVSDILKNSVSTLAGHEENMRTSFARGNGIGMGEFGPGWAIQELAEMARECLEDIAQRCDDSIEALWAVFWMMIHKNSELGDEFLRKNPELYYTQLPIYADAESIFNEHNARLAEPPSDAPFDYVIGDLEDKMNQDAPASPLKPEQPVCVLPEPPVIRPWDGK